MDRRAPEQQDRPTNPEREQIIHNIIEHDRKTFTDWVSVNPNQPRLDLPPAAIRYLIPRKLYDLVDDPSKLAIRTADSNEQALGFLIVEETPSPITNFDSLVKHQGNVKRAAEAEPRLPRPEIPLDVDPKHDFYWKVLEKYGVKPNEKILLGLWLDQFDTDELFVNSYDDRPGYRGKGVATSAYDRLREVAKLLGERYITGENIQGSNGNFGSVDFFVNKLGRLRFADLPENLREKFVKRHEHEMDQEDADFWTIDFLYPEERPSRENPENLP